MLEPEDLPATDLTSSEKRLGTEKGGLEVLLADPRMQVPDLATKKEILRLLYVSGAFKPQTFDAVMTPEAVETLTVANMADYVGDLKLVEMKTTRAPIRNTALNGFFFGATDSEFQMAKALKERYLFAFVVLGNENDFGRPFLYCYRSPSSRRERERRASSIRSTSAATCRRMTRCGRISAPVPDPGRWEGHRSLFTEA